MSFDALDRTLDLIRVLVPVVARISGHDTNLANQLRRAISSVALNVPEGSARRGRDRTNRFRCANGSAAEVMAALRVAVAFGYLDAADIAPSLELADRVRRMTYALAK